MTPEQRFERIERNIEDITQRQKDASAEIERQNEGIKSLIVVARTCLDSFKELPAVQDKGIEETRELHRRMIEEVRELHKHTDEKLNILIDTVDRIIRRGDNRKA